VQHPPDPPAGVPSPPLPTRLTPLGSPRPPVRPPPSALALTGAAHLSQQAAGAALRGSMRCYAPSIRWDPQVGCTRQPSCRAPAGPAQQSAPAPSLKGIHAPPPPPPPQVQGYFEAAFGARRLQEISQRLCVPSLKPTLRLNTLRLSTEVGKGSVGSALTPAAARRRQQRPPWVCALHTVCHPPPWSLSLHAQDALRALQQVLPPGSQQPYAHPLVPLTLVVPGAGPSTSLDYALCGEQGQAAAPC
jgi:hypothetical protein